MIRLTDLLNESKKPATRKEMADWIGAFNNAVFKGVQSGYMIFKASSFAVKGMKRELDKYGIGIKEFGGDKYGIKVSDKNQFHWGTNESVVDVSDSTVVEQNLTEASYSDTYFDSFVQAVEHVQRVVKKKGYEIDPDDWFNKVFTGGRYTRGRPSKGKTHSFSVQLLKNGKETRKMVHFQVYNMGNTYELNMYIN